MKTVMVFDTNVLLLDPNALLVYENAEILVPQVVLTELDKLKTFRSDRSARFRGREVSRLLFELSEYGSLTDGVELDNNSIVKVVPFNPVDFPENLNPKNADDQILGCALQQAKLKPDAEVVLVTNDLNMLLKAQTLGVRVIQHEREFEATFWSKLGKIFYKRFSFAWVLWPLIAVLILSALWLFKVPSPIKTSNSALEIGSFAVQENDLQASLKKSPKDYKVWYELGRLYLNWGKHLDQRTNYEEANAKYSLAIDTLNHARQLHPNSAAIVNDIGTAYFLLGNIEDAVSEFIQAINMQPNYALAHFNLGYVLYNHNRDLKGALRELETYLKLEPLGQKSEEARQMIEKIKIQQATAP